MGFFSEKNKSNTNQISNKELKETLADTALALLVNTQEITVDDFVGIKAEFGYLLMIKDHGLEGLFKIIKDDKIYYFAAQKEKLQLINIDENQYCSTIEYMLKQHA